MSAVSALLVELRVHRVGADLFGMELAPERAEANVVLAPAQRAGTVAGSEGGRLVEEEELREPPRLQQRLPMPAAELEPARDPALAVVCPTDSTGGIVQAAAVAVHEAARRIGDQLAEGRDPVLERQRG